MGLLSSKDEFENSIVLTRIERILEVRRNLIENIRPVLPEQKRLSEKYAEIDKLFLEILKMESSQLILNSVDIEKSLVSVKFHIESIDDFAKGKEMILKAFEESIALIKK